MDSRLRENDMVARSTMRRFDGAPGSEGQVKRQSAKRKWQSHYRVLATTVIPAQAGIHLGSIESLGASCHDVSEEK